MTSAGWSSRFREAHEEEFVPFLEHAIATFPGPWNVREIRFHDLRATYASVLLMSGAALVSVQRLLGHSDPKITERRYGRLLPDFMAAEVNRLRFGLDAFAPRPSTPPPLRGGYAQGEREGLWYILGTSAVRESSTLGMVREEVRRGRFVPLLHEPWMRSSWSVVRLRRRPVPPAMAALVAELERANREALEEEQALRQAWERGALLPAPSGARRRQARPGCP